MESTQDEILDANLEPAIAVRRRMLLPWWAKIFTWLFLIFGAITPIAFILGLQGINFQVSFYCLSTYNPTSLIGIFVLFLFLFKGIVAYGLWTEKDWAINIGQADAIMGILICIFMMIYPFIDAVPGFNLNMRVELFFLIPFFSWLGRMREKWNNGFGGE